MPSTVDIYLDFRRVNGHHDITKILSPGFTCSAGDRINLKIDLNRTGLLYPDYLLLVVAFINHFRSNGIELNHEIVNLNSYSDKVKYASRINFFNLIGHEFTEDFIRHSSSGRFTEIVEFTNDNANTLHDELIKILIQNNVQDHVMITLNYCLWEVIDNTLNHSSNTFKYGDGKGFLCSQYFPNLGVIRIMIADTGIGIHESLTTRPGTQFGSLTPKESVLRCIEKGVTNGGGMGFGLWSAAELIRLNQGRMIIHSQDYCLTCKNQVNIEQVSPWKGTFTFLEINTDIPIDHELIFGQQSGQGDDYAWLKEKLIDNSNDLW